MPQKNKKGIGYYLLYGTANVLALLPFGILYLISDILYIIVYHIFKYRKRVVRKNLFNSLPEKSKSEILKIEKRFYHHLCDYFVETIKILRISDKEIQKRMVFRNPDLLNHIAHNGNSCLLALGHYGNWEYVPSIGMYLSPIIEQGQVYKKLSSPAFESFFLKLRGRFSPKNIEMKSIYRTIITNNRDNKTMTIGFLSDQRAPLASSYITTFLNQETRVFTGLERIARQFGFAIVYLDIKKVKRGYYVGDFSIITYDAKLEKENAVLEKYMKKLEKTIKYDPAYYLWSHNKWKHNKSNNSEKKK